MDTISNMDFDFVASGHYAKVVHTVTDENNKLSFLELSKDMVNIHFSLYIFKSENSNPFIYKWVDLGYVIYLTGLMG